VEAMNNLPATQKLFTVAHASDTSAVRRGGIQLAESLGFDETTTGQIAIVITEAATNILKHAGTGLVVLTPVGQVGNRGIEILALDRGPGIGNFAQSIEDGISTTGTSGNGLGAIRRLSHQFDVYSGPDVGSAFYMCFWANLKNAVPDPLQVGVICMPVAGEEECGDAWAISQADDLVKIIVADGLGHGPDAAVASIAAINVMRNAPQLRSAALMEAMHQALRPTRGAAVALMEIEITHGLVNFIGIGNISACIIDQENRKQLVSHNGIVGNNMRKVQQFSMPWSRGALSILCSDGIGTQWDLLKYPGLYFRHPALIAGVIFRDFIRVRDDATVVVLRHT
jgi:anti-sigma regulatory factor (Ser/Thr protein kinase)